jgi:hypothetical protein
MSTLTIAPQPPHAHHARGVRTNFYDVHRRLNIRLAALATRVSGEMDAP